MICIKTRNCKEMRPEEGEWSKKRERERGKKREREKKGWSAQVRERER